MRANNNSIVQLTNLMCVCVVVLLLLALAARLLLCLLAMMSSCSLCYHESQRKIICGANVAIACILSLSPLLIASVMGEAPYSVLQINHKNLLQKNA